MAAVDHGPGASPRRVEDPPLIRGTASYTDDLKVPGVLHAHFVRAGWAHARIAGIDTSEAVAAPGVVGVFTAADLDLAPMPAGSAPDGMARPVLAHDRVRFGGEAIAVVVADTRAH